MTQVNPKVEYDNLEGFPSYDGNEIHYLKSTTDLVNLKDVSVDEIKTEMDFNNPQKLNYNYIQEAPTNILQDIKKEIFTFPVMTANETTVGDITYIASSSSQYNDTYAAWKAFTGTFAAETDAWQSVALPTVDAPQWLKIYCGGQDIFPLYWTFGNCGSYTRSMKNFVIQGSNDDTEWTDLVTDINYSNIANDTFFVYSTIKNQSFKYFRTLITTGNATDLVKIGNWSMIGYLNSSTITIPSNIDENNPLKYVDDNGTVHTITTPLSINVQPNSYTNIVPHMNSNEEQGWTLTSNRMNGYAYAQPYFMTSGINTQGFHCNTAIATNNISYVSYAKDTTFTPVAFKIKNRWDYGSGIAYEAIIGFNVKNEKSNVLYRTNQHYRLAQNTWQEFKLQRIEPCTSFIIEAFNSDNTNAYHNYGRGFEILVEDNNGTDFLEWSTSYIFLNTTTNQLVEEKGKFTISQIVPTTPKNNDLWLSILNKGRVYKFDGTNWNLTTYIPIAMIVFNYYQIAKVYNYPINANWYDLTIKSMWKSAELMPATNAWIMYPHNQQMQNIKNKFYDVILINKVAEFGYEPGDIAEGISMDYVATDNRYPMIYLDDELIGIHTGTLNTGISILQKNSSTEQYITLANWRLIFRIW